MTRLSESQIIDILRKNAGMKRSVREDVEIFRRGSDIIVTAIDTLVQSTDVPPGMKTAEISRKSISACISDFAAKGTRPDFGTISVTIPSRFARGRIVELAKGFQKASREFGVKIIGGDVNEGIELSISVSLYGITDSIIPRGGAMTGDRVFVTGYFGNTAAGLRLLLGWKKSGNTRLDAIYRNAFCNPKPKLDFGVRAKKYLSSAMDSSDGLARTLNEMARQSRKRITVTALPFERTLEVFAGRNKVSAEDLTLFGGEEYETVFTVPEKSIRKIRQIAKDVGTKVIEVGIVGAGSGVLNQLTGRKIPDVGWSHFDDQARIIPS